MKVKAVIGGSYGDEGKGLMVDYLARTEYNPLVIRFQGGAQAGHTVNEGWIRHVFSHVGSGTLAGAPTLLAKNFVVNPLIFDKEMEELKQQGVVLRAPIWIDPRCRVTTPYDMLVNQILEKSRGDKRHGSVGLGFGETIEQHERYGFALEYGEITEMTVRELESRLTDIQNEWFIPRLKELGVDYKMEDYGDDMFFNEINRRFINASFGMVDHPWEGTHQLEDLIYLDPDQTLIFEGAQGLLLDQNGKDFPHVTRSNTGLQDVDELLEAPEDVEAEVFYMSRAYMTRHGAGPLENEVDSASDLGFHVIDKTNQSGEYQGDLRFAPLDIPQFIGRTGGDFAEYGKKFNKKSHVFTCLDQMDKAKVLRARNGNVEEVRRCTLIDELVANSEYISLGPMHRDVTPTKNLEKLRRIWE